MSAGDIRSEVVDLGGCEGCALGCAVTCDDGREDRAQGARRILVAAGLGSAIISLGPGLVARHDVVTALGLVSAAVGLVITLLAAVALRRGRPGGDAAARLAFRLLPVASAGMLATAAGAVLLLLT